MRKLSRTKLKDIKVKEWQDAQDVQQQETMGTDLNIPITAGTTGVYRLTAETV